MTEIAIRERVSSQVMPPRPVSGDSNVIYMNAVKAVISENRDLLAGLGAKSDAFEVLIKHAERLAW